MQILGIRLVVIGIPGMIFGFVPGLICIGVGALCMMAGK